MSHLNTAYKLGSIQAQVEFEDWLRKQSAAAALAGPAAASAAPAARPRAPGKTVIPDVITPKTAPPVARGDVAFEPTQGQQFQRRR